MGEYLANRARLTANRTVTGPGHPGEGTALCQGIIGCGSCGHPMTVRYLRDGHGFYECHSNVPIIDGTCRSISAGTIDAAVVNRRPTALTPAEIELAFTAGRPGRRRPWPGYPKPLWNHAGKSNSQP